MLAPMLSRAGRIAAARRSLCTQARPFKVAVLPGDGIGPEVMAEALKVLTRAGQIFGASFDFVPAHVGGAAFDAHGEHFPESTRLACEQSDGILFGSVGGPVAEQHLPKWHNAEVGATLAAAPHAPLHTPHPHRRRPPCRSGTRCWGCARRSISR